jgi:hypothetical protein
MDKMTISDFYDQLLSDKEFQEPETGNLFFPAYIYQYDSKDEYNIRKQIRNLKDRLIRPNNFVDTLILNIYDEFISFLKDEKMGGESILDLITQNDTEKEMPDNLKDVLFNKANSLAFFNYINEKATTHFKEPSKFKKVYLMLYGFGSIYPFLRTSTYLKNFEEHVKGYKLIVFFPGYYENKKYHLFGELHDENIYRATLINP